MAVVWRRRRKKLLALYPFHRVFVLDLGNLFGLVLFEIFRTYKFFFDILEVGAVIDFVLNQKLEKLLSSYSFREIALLLCHNPYNWPNICWTNFYDFVFVLNYFFWLEKPHDQFLKTNFQELFPWGRQQLLNLETVGCRAVCLGTRKSLFILDHFPNLTMMFWSI